LKIIPKVFVETQMGKRYLGLVSTFKVYHHAAVGSTTF